MYTQQNLDDDIVNHLGGYGNFSNTKDAAMFFYEKHPSDVIRFVDSKLSSKGAERHIRTATAQCFAPGIQDAKKIFDKKIALIASFLLAVSWMHIFYSFLITSSY